MVAAELNALSNELEAQRRTGPRSRANQMGLALKVITRQNVVFMSEHAEQVARVVQESGDIDHRRGSIKYVRAKNIRRVAAK